MYEPTQSLEYYGNLLNYAEIDHAKDIIKYVLENDPEVWSNSCKGYQLINLQSWPERYNATPGKRLKHMDDIVSLATEHILREIKYIPFCFREFADAQDFITFSIT